MEDSKSPGPRPFPRPRAPSRRDKITRGVVAGLAAGIIFLSTRNYFPVEYPHAPEPAATASFSWDKLEPSRSLEYSDCGGDFQCARLAVPMDYNKTSEHDRNFVLAVVRIPAKVPVDDPRYGGAVLINPGE